MAGTWVKVCFPSLPPPPPVLFMICLLLFRRMLTSKCIFLRDVSDVSVGFRVDFDSRKDNLQVYKLVVISR